MARRGTAADSRKQPRTGEETLDWERFNFLENLLIFCAVPPLRVPEESGVRFGINRTPTDQAACLLFQIDRREDPLVTDPAEWRPDYLAVYLSAGACICTIIEMKGRDQGNLGHGCDQIVSFRDRLRREIKEHLPGSIRPVYQGLLLCPPNSQIPGPRIQREADAGLTIVPLQHPHTFELFPYVSQDLTRAGFKRYQHQKLPHDPGHSHLEDLLVHRALRARLPGSLARLNHPNVRSPGLYVNYQLSDGDEYAALVSQRRRGGAHVREAGDEHARRIEACLAALGLTRAFPVSRL